MVSHWIIKNMSIKRSDGFEGEGTRESDKLSNKIVWTIMILSLGGLSTVVWADRNDIYKKMDAMEMRANANDTSIAVIIERTKSIEEKIDRILRRSRW